MQAATATAVGAERPAHSGGGASSDAASTQDADELAAAFSEDLTLSVREGEPTTLTAGEVKGMTPAELAKYYKVRPLQAGSRRCASRDIAWWSQLHAAPYRTHAGFASTSMREWMGSAAKAVCST